MPAPKVGVAVPMASPAGRPKVPSSRVAAAAKAAPSSVPPAARRASASFSASVVSGVSTLRTVPPVAVVSVRKGLPGGSETVAPVASSV